MIVLDTAVLDGCVFVMGDNRDNAADGRVHGPIPLHDPKDKPLFIYWPRDWSRIGLAIR